LAHLSAWPLRRRRRLLSSRRCGRALNRRSSTP
jgi:hypothetical protein